MEKGDCTKDFSEIKIFNENEHIFTLKVNCLFVKMKVALCLLHVSHSGVHDDVDERKFIVLQLRRKFFDAHFQK